MYIHILAQTRFSLQYKVLTLSCYRGEATEPKPPFVSESQHWRESLLLVDFPLMRHSYLAAIPEALTYYFQIIKKNQQKKIVTLHCWENGFLVALKSWQCDQNKAEAEFANREIIDIRRIKARNNFCSIC